MAMDFVGRPWREAEAELRAAGLSYAYGLTRPTRDFFKVDERYLYVLRERKSPEGKLEFVLAARPEGVLSCPAVPVCAGKEVL